MLLLNVRVLVDNIEGIVLQWRIFIRKVEIHNNPEAIFCQKQSS